MKPTSNLDQMLPKQLQRVISYQMFELVQQNVAQILMVSFKQELR